jgi:hypothetical protein
VKCDTVSGQRAARGRNVPEAYKGSTEERNVKWDVLLLREALNPRQFRKRSYTREDCVSRDWYESNRQKNCAHVTRPRREHGLTDRNRHQDMPPGTGTGHSPWASGLYRGHHDPHRMSRGRARATGEA